MQYATVSCSPLIMGSLWLLLLLAVSDDGNTQVYCSALQCVTVCCSKLQSCSVAVCCSVLQYVACCSVVQYVAVRCSPQILGSF